VLSLAPTILLFFAAFQFVGTSMEYWFSAQVERSLMEAQEISQAYTKQLVASTTHFAQRLARDLEKRGLNLSRPSKALARFIESKRDLYHLAAVRLFSAEMAELTYATQSGTHISHLQRFPLDLVSRVLATGKGLAHQQSAPTGEFVAAVEPVRIKGKVVAAVAAFNLLPRGSLAKMAAIAKGLEGYRQLKAVKQPIKTNTYITLSIVTLLIIFSATWFGFYLAKTITVPLMELAQATQRIAEGDYDFFIDLEGPDEIGTLVNAFNKMTADLKTSKARLDEAQAEMRRTNRELDQRRRYMEIVLNSVAAGVVAVDAAGRITTFNPSAERMLKVRAGSARAGP
jgi:two-component system nitrogen regulation sensor histidine kinase NtrY